MEPERETALLLRIREGSPEAFHELYELYQKPLANYFYRLAWNAGMVDDLVQEVFLRLWRSARDYEPQAKPSTYIFRVAHNLWLNHAAKRRAEALEGADPAQDRDPAEGLQKQELQRAVRKAIEALPEGERECLILSEYNGLKYAEIGEILGIPVGTVKSRIFSAVQKLKVSLKGL